MLKSSKFCNPRFWRRHTSKQIITNAIYILIFSYLILYSIFNVLFLYKFAKLGPYQPDKYDIENLTVRPVSCAFSISGMYERTPRYMCYVLLIFTVVVRSHKWLAVGAAAWVLTYSGVASIHMVILFATNNKLHPLKTKSHCEYLPVPRVSTPFIACTGVEEPDVGLAMAIVSSVMLGALPMAAWSSTFRRSTSKVILLLWLLLLAVGHTLFPLTRSKFHTSFQICRKNHTEPLPTANFQAPSLDQSWRDSFYSLVSTGQQPSKNDSSSACIYSCFAIRGYPGRTLRDIHIFDGVGTQHVFLKSEAASHRGSILVWWLYTLLAFVTLFVTEKKNWLPQKSHKVLFSFEYRQQLSALKCLRKTITYIATRGVKDPSTTVSSNVSTPVKIHITVLKAIQVFAQLISVGAFFFSIITQETRQSQKWSYLSEEPFGAVGQWGNLAVVVMVLIAAGVDRMMAGSGVGSVSDEETRFEEGIVVFEGEEALKRDKSSLDDSNNDRRDGDDENMETEIEDWDWRVGYAS